ncbi:MAG: vitamin K epoxide reductase [Candidatus Parvarchaeota archaeon]|nr:vitamin K epoxide reductase [Candidatus Parvarchaeota archaeon]
MIYLALSFSASVIPQNSCTISGTVLNCGKVVTSQYSKIILGINNYYLGAAFFMLVIALSILLILKPNISILKVKLIHIMLVLGILGSAVSVYLIYLELFVIGYICVLCSISQISIFLTLVVSALWSYSDSKKKNL